MVRTCMLKQLTIELCYKVGLLKSVLKSVFCSRAVILKHYSHTFPTLRHGHTHLEMQWHIETQLIFPFMFYNNDKSPQNSPLDLFPIWNGKVSEAYTVLLWWRSVQINITRQRFSNKSVYHVFTISFLLILSWKAVDHDFLLTPVFYSKFKVNAARKLNMNYILVVEKQPFCDSKHWMNNWWLPLVWAKAREQVSLSIVQLTVFYISFSWSHSPQYSKAGGSTSGLIVNGVKQDGGVRPLNPTRGSGLRGLWG